MTHSITKQRMYFTRLIIILFFSALYVSNPLMAQEGLRDHLVSVAWLNKNLKNSDLLIIDASPSRLYNLNHIPGAFNYDLYSYGPKELPVDEIEKRYQSWGISPEKKIILYDQGGSILATRFLFSLDYYGFPTKNLYILDGGLTKWQAEGLTVTSEPATAQKKGSFKIKKLNTDVRVDLPEFLQASGDPSNNVLLEALDPDWHFGMYNFFGRPGHIPNAILLPVADFYNPDKTFKSSEDIIKELSYLGISTEKNIYTHCGGGIAASVPYFALKYLLGYTNVKLFPGSQLEWASDQRELPFWTYDAPFLMRDAAWLQSWGGKMMRMYGISHVSFLDIRPADKFRMGHLQYANNIPPDVFKSNVTHPGQMADALSLAGVDTSNEVVIISGGGLTREAALAFVMLEKLGQKKISLYMDQTDKWEDLGFSVIRDTTSDDAKKNVPNTAESYPVNLSNRVIITDLNNITGIFPKLFIVSGLNTPAQSRDNKVVNIAYTDLLNSDGTPKAAKDIWNILATAGIPRYAELVCYSDDPGEAAVIYFILRLMGFPDINVLLN